MGVLDDAIRDHLELKRKHGASDEEIQKEEQEALGPPASNLHPSPAPQQEASYEPVDAPGGDPDLGAEPRFEEEEARPFEEEPLAPEPAGLYDEQVLAEEQAILPAEDDEPLPGEELEPEDVAAPPAEPPSRDFFDDSELFADEEPLAEPEPQVDRGPDEGLPESDDGDDLLEETPEFLQDTPEGDRLWFEQKPPKDFDFDD
jgi:hypothetical protein